MTKYLIYTILFLTVVAIFSCKTEDTKEPENLKRHVLIYSKTQGYRHECIEPGRIALKNYFSSFNITSEISEDSTVFTPDRLKHFDVIMFFQTTGNVLDSVQQIAFENYIRSGKGFVGVHSASDTEYNWPWYGRLVGAQFTSHPEIQQHVVQKEDTSHLTVKHLPDRWLRTDECYNFKQLPDSVHVLLTLDETTYQGGTHGMYHPIAWYHLVDGGRSFYTGLGHTVESYSDTLFLEHVRQGVVWAGGK